MMNVLENIEEVMTAGYNKAFVLGDVKDIPHMRYSQHGDPHALLTVKCTTKDFHYDAIVHTDWLTVACFGELAEYAERNLNPGDLIWAEGPIQLLNWKDGRSIIHKDTVIAAEKLYLLHSAQTTQTPPFDNQTNRAGSKIKQTEKLKKETK